MSDLMNHPIVDGQGDLTNGLITPTDAPSDLPSPDSYGPFAQMFSVATIATCSYITMLIC